MCRRPSWSRRGTKKPPERTQCSRHSTDCQRTRRRCRQASSRCCSVTADVLLFSLVLCSSSLLPRGVCAADVSTNRRDNAVITSGDHDDDGRISGGVSGHRTSVPSFLFGVKEEPDNIFQAPNGKQYDIASITVNCSAAVAGGGATTALADDCAAANGQGNVTIFGFLVPRVNGDNLVLGALTWAVFQANENSTDHTFKFCAEESGESGEFWAMRKMTAMRSHGVKAFIGPDESCMSEAILAAAWDLPMISYVSTTSLKFFSWCATSPLPVQFMFTSCLLSPPPCCVQSKVDNGSWPAIKTTLWEKSIVVRMA